MEDTVFTCTLNDAGKKVLKQNNYEGESTENIKSAIKIRNTARLSSKLITVILIV